MFNTKALAHKNGGSAVKFFQATVKMANQHVQSKLTQISSKIEIVHMDPQISILFIRKKKCNTLLDHGIIFFLYPKYGGKFGICISYKNL